MKKIIIFLFLFFLTSCFGGNKEETLNQGNEKNISQTASGDLIENTNQNESEKKDDKAFFRVENLDEKNFISILPMDESEIKGDEIEILGQSLSSDIDKIEVSFQNKDSSFPSDRYTLKTFSPGDKSFRYIASAGFRVLDFGLNEYTFIAYSGEDKSEVKVSIFLPEESNGEKVNDNFSSDEILEALPQGGDFGDVILKGDTFTYSNIENLEIKKESLASLVCSESDTITDFLVERYSWVYWNSCRELVKGKGLSLNILRLKGEEYLYEKHYFDFIHNLHFIYLLEKGTGIDKEGLADKNTELKEKEFSFSLVENLFKQVINK
ncbi:hypothetical protein HGA92_01355 [Candidatus Gracilibacteria bacterium]|nr:hypothetical protein [Candidatus Gracilibacteria bacterium]NUJ98744.1 hypothetical protein [Candidatus Gracilibacteria bacterium]